MNRLNELAKVMARIQPILPKHRDLYYGGRWQAPAGGYLETWNPATGDSLGPCAEANAGIPSGSKREGIRGDHLWFPAQPDRPGF